MGYKILKDKIFHIPTERIKEAERDIKEDDELIRRINAKCSKKIKEILSAYL